MTELGRYRSSAELPRGMAFVSGKGGSGKTLIAAEVASILSRYHEVCLVDADVGTAGLSYYLGLKYVRNIRKGLSDLLLRPSPEPPAAYVQPIIGRSARSDFFESVSLLPLGDHRRITRALRDNHERPNFAFRISSVVEQLMVENPLVVVDCRGGIDDESIAVCQAVDDIFLIVESDTTSFQASRHLVDTLSDLDLVHKLRGFIINKVYSNPEAVIRAGAGDFGSQFLVAIPFDFAATRSFLIGDLPGQGSAFAVHVQEALSKAYPEVVPRPTGQVWSEKDYDGLDTVAPESSRGGILLSVLLVTLATVMLLSEVFGTGLGLLQLRLGLTAMVLLGVAAGAEPSRRAVGWLIGRYLKAFSPRRADRTAHR
ncbi:AAA family ATPase [Winogradskya humida]|uniref:CobQ/CobB/MinD/ParA nucleotide binding domain-containing protein n=1 Tax=Winogradskya humida TaxID=113566 RepID=A0ABQ3ZPB8_9ACTN|nr:ParA family protein [Actinoplanes humidus]GIE20434.1 hypothetical protein Ahu01nite_035360 [Actinoplanes humidus]